MVDLMGHDDCKDVHNAWRHIAGKRVFRACADTYPEDVERVQRDADARVSKKIRDGDCADIVEFRGNEDQVVVDELQLWTIKRGVVQQPNAQGRPYVQIPPA